MYKDIRIEHFANKLLELVRGVIIHHDYREYQNVSEKIDEAANTENKFRIHIRYPFLTDMFFHVIAAGLKTKIIWLDWH